MNPFAYGFMGVHYEIRDVDAAQTASQMQGKSSYWRWRAWMSPWPGFKQPESVRPS